MSTNIGGIMIDEINNYKYLFFKKLYNYLGLKEMEQTLIKEKINSLEVISNEKYDIISNYFFLLNDVNINNLNKVQLDKFHLYFSKEVKYLKEDELKEIYEFIDDTYKLLLFPNADSNYVYYGPINDNYSCPKDAIAIGLYYDAFGEYDDFEVKNKLADVINYIQFNLAKKINEKVAVISFNQKTLKNEFGDFSK